MVPDVVVAEQLGVPAGGRVHVLQRLRSAMGEPVAIEHIQLSAARFPDLLEHDLAGSLWVLLRSRYDVASGQGRRARRGRHARQVRGRGA